MFIISPDSVVSEICTLEIEHSIQHDKLLVPVVWRDVEDDQVHMLVHNWVFLRAEDDFEASLEFFIGSLDTNLEYVRERTHLLTRAINWDQNNRIRELALSRQELQVAEKWLTQGLSTEPKPAELHSEYLAFSRISIDRLQRLIVVGVSIIFVLVVLSVFSLFQRQLLAIESVNIVEEQRREIDIRRQLAEEQQPVAFRFSTASSDKLIFERDSEWKYFRGIQEPLGPEYCWQETRFDDTQWETGPAPFYYGDGTGGTFLGDMQKRYCTLYLRRLFRVDDPDNISGLDFIVDFDDGFRMWINNKEVLSINVPSSLKFNSFASDQHESGEFETFEIANPSSFLKKGVNIIAIHGINVSQTSSDFLINAELVSIEADFNPPLVAFISPKSGKVSQLRQVTIHFSEPVTGIDADDLLLEGQPAEGMEGKNDTWTFSFSPIDYGDAVLTWNPDHKIQDTARPPNPFDDTVVGET